MQANIGSVCASLFDVRRDVVLIHLLLPTANNRTSIQGIYIGRYIQFGDLPRGDDHSC